MASSSSIPNIDNPTPRQNHFIDELIKTQTKALEAVSITDPVLDCSVAEVVPDDDDSTVEILLDDDDDDDESDVDTETQRTDEKKVSGKGGDDSKTAQYVRLTKKEREALHWVTMEYGAARDRLAPGRSRLAKGAMDLLKEQARSKFNLPPQWNPSNETVWSKLKRRLQYSIPLL
ncbi:unnamed protein product [Cylindrotheca closterium]|uniref:Uncharacterized protein n=1 Tax=Cylindrotheca closterium TaxID=2856 RepID=A0AAD2G8L9_9STRA|nr:unnamed protein product [Cylindrotheca closterium]